MSETALENKPELPKGEKPSIFKFITEPQEQFRRMRENPKVLVPLLIVTAVYALWAALFSFLADFQLMMGDLSAEDMAMIEGAETAIRVSTFVTSLLMPVIGGVIGAFIMWIVVKLTAGDATFKQLFSLNVFIMFIGGIGLVLNSILTLALNLNPAQMITGLTVFFDPYDPMYSLVSLFEVFSIWSIILMAMGLRIVASMKPVTAWVVTLIITVGAALIGFLAAGV
ncbi:hypothetical protein BpOF4_05885 [Alkalihalophilus pseudofirmus OF4]|uniref:Yip1 domain-containing protein n=1 Tax=Alkalihalophilus pseudofirmus (strain ATCC BAA-2126 / JCM 17055 / OF4) TaxID=398511 RepID=D3FZJ7_ALKPO|nr:Yip1 family protein [Alkalihalophilus pseudofirmus]ADC49239.1 hypothetical protein BpOF4_05885 [Alkalihalophilus pseudofirmus OF4]